MKPTPFSYVVLRYMHDAFTREFVNIGVLLHVPLARCTVFEKLSHFDRMKGMFPGLQVDSLREILRFIAGRVTQTSEAHAELFNEQGMSADSVANKILPMDDSTLQWSPPGGGLTENPAQTLKDIYERLVTRHLKTPTHIRKDDTDVWKKFENELRPRRVLQKLQEKTLFNGELKHRFERSWQTPAGGLHLLQPLSFDLVDPSDIVEKAVKWSGLIHQLRKTDPDFQIYFLLGRPSGENRASRAFHQACDTLNEAPVGRRELVFEEQAPEFAEILEKAMVGVEPN